MRNSCLTNTLLAQFITALDNALTAMLVSMVDELRELEPELPI
jgi:hypothetical protein